MGRGKVIHRPHEALIRDLIFSRYGWSFRQFLEAPEWLLEEQLAVVSGEAEGSKAGPAGGGGSTYGASMQTASELASAGGLLPPSGVMPTDDGEDDG